MKGLLVVYCWQNGARHVYGPVKASVARALFRQFNRHHKELGIQSYGIMPKELFDRDEQRAGRAA